MPLNTSQYYNNLNNNRIPLRELLKQNKLFHKIPEDWHVIITDIKNSTQAVLDGSHENVNLIATGSIVTVLNLAFKNNISVPFFFGGDGATFIVPPSIAGKSLEALLSYKANTKENFNLELRVGSVAVADIYEHGHSLHISKFSLSEYFSIPVLLGSGLDYAEKIIKGNDYLLSQNNPSKEELDLSGMQCRWDKIAPPDNTNEIVTLLVVATAATTQREIFSKVISLMDEIYGAPEKRQPISVSKLKLKTTFDKLSLEMLARIGNIKMLKLIQNWLINLLGYFYLRSKKGKTYLDLLVKMSDTLVIDGKINTVISGTEKQRKMLQSALDVLEKEGKILYGLHLSNESIMSCYVRDMKDGHIHFVDGADGGYTMAATMLKTKFKDKMVQN